MKRDSFYKQIDLGTLPVLPFDPWQVDTTKIVTLKNDWVQIHLGRWFTVCRGKDSGWSDAVREASANLNSPAFMFLDCINYPTR